MLNKLLKRCMPWMDKGRWYHIHIEGDAESGYTVTHDSIFSRYETQGRFINVYFADPEIKKTIIDVKVISHPAQVEPYIILDVYSGVNLELIDGSYALNLAPINGVIDYWLFMR